MRCRFGVTLKPPSGATKTNASILRAGSMLSRSKKALKAPKSAITTDRAEPSVIERAISA